MNKYFANNLRFFRSCNQYTQEYMSHVLHISRQTYSHYETGYRTPDLETFLAISTHLNVPMEYFFMENPSYHYFSQKELLLLLTMFPQLPTTTQQQIYELIRKYLTL